MLPFQAREFAQDTHPEGVKPSLHRCGAFVAWADMLLPEDEEQDDDLEWSWGLIVNAPVYVKPKLLAVPVKEGWWYCLLDVDSFNFEPGALVWCHEDQLDGQDNPMTYCCSESTGCEVHCLIDKQLTDLYDRWESGTLVTAQLPVPPWTTIAAPELLMPTFEFNPTLDYQPTLEKPVVIQQPELIRTQNHCARLIQAPQTSKRLALKTSS